jgi:hypothetical protein
MNLASAFNAFDPTKLNWRRALSYGVLWGVAVSTLASFDLPLGDLSGMQLLLLEVRLVPDNCLQGIALSSATMVLDRRLTPLWIAPFLVAFLPVAFAGNWLFWKGLPIPGAESLPTWAIEPHYVHTVWFSVFCGGLFVAAYRLSAESERTRALFVQAEIARQQTESLLSAERVRALQGHVDPAFLLRVMVEVERRYAHDAAGMERLLDPLVSFLRAAMPGVRSGASTLAAEALLAMHYAKLRAELEPGRTTWRIRVDGVMPDVPFPALLLLPVLDQLVADDNAGSGAELQIAGERDGRFTLSLSRTGARRGRWLAPDLLYRLQVGLRTVFGEAWELAVREHPDSPAFALTLPLDSHHLPRQTVDAACSTPTHQETHHG